MNRKFAPMFVLLILALVTLACGLGKPSDEGAEATSPPAEATEPPAAPTPTLPPAESEEETEEEQADYDTVFPLPDG